jgi:hypothetical protein
MIASTRIGLLVERPFLPPALAIVCPHCFKSNQLAGAYPSLFVPTVSRLERLTIMANEPTAIIEKLGVLSARLTSGDDTAEDARNEALQLSRQLTSCLEQPVTTAVDLAFAVSFSNQQSSQRSLYRLINRIAFYVRCSKNSSRDGPLQIHRPTRWTDQLQGSCGKVRRRGVANQCAS